MIDDTDTDEFVGPEPKSSAGVLAALKKAEDAFRDWQVTCSDIDAIYNLGDSADGLRHSFGAYEFTDTKLDLFWSSFEVMKPAVYARPPQPVVAPLFKDGRRLPNTTAELLERCAVSVLTRTGIDAVMKLTRDDLIFNSRGVMWLTYEADKDGKRVCVEHTDRKDFLHEPVRKWAENGWAAKRSWLTKAGMRKRFKKTSGDRYQDAQYLTAKDRDGDRAQEDRASTRKAGVWEVWHRADNKVYWVTEGVDVFLDEDEPHLKLSGFFPCPQPAYGTTRRRSLVPIPDYRRYAIHFRKISDLTGRIYLLLDKVRMKGLIPAGGDIGDAIEELIRSDDDEILIPVPGAAMLATGAAGGFVAWLPLAELAQAIQGLIEARTQLINDFYQLSGISDIMRGATEADETLGAQQLKTQFGSVRVREKSQEMQRIAADAVKIAAEIIAEKFDQGTLIEMSQMQLPTKADIKKRIAEIQKGAEEELKALGQKAQEAAEKQAQQPQQDQQPIDPDQAQQMLQQAQQQVLAKYAPLLAEVEEQVPIEDVVKLLRDDKARGFTFEIESSSTILTDELEEKRSRNEFMEAFTNSSQALMGLTAMGEPGAKLAGAMMKFVLAPYRAGRELDGAIDTFIDAAREMAKAMQAQQGNGDAEGLVEANNKLAEAEQMKAQAAMAAVQAKSELAQADNQRKIMELQQKSSEAQAKSELEVEKLRQSLAAEQSKGALMDAQINKLTADTAKILASIGLDERKQQLSEYSAATQAQAQQVDQAMAVEGQQTDAQFREREHGRADRQQDFTEKQSMTEGQDG